MLPLVDTKLSEAKQINAKTVLLHRFVQSYLTMHHLLQVPWGGTFVCAKCVP